MAPIKDQGSCGSCWTFSATGTLESLECISKGSHEGDLTQLSQQQLIDCSGAYGNYGCDGGWYYWAWDYYQGTKGSEPNYAISLANYPYKGVDTQCAYNTTANTGIYTTSHVNIPAGEPTQMEAALANGPISIAIFANTTEFMSYAGGVFTGPADCGSNN